MHSLPPNSAVDMSPWMDRLSDRLGSLIPGGSRWPPRHPVKVSLVMGILARIIHDHSAKWPPAA